MGKKLITLCYRKIIDANSSGAWERMIFEDTYTEFLMQVQNYNLNKQHQTFAQLLQHVPEAGKLHFLVSSACLGYLQQLNEKVPDITDQLGRLVLTFKSFQFELINSDISNLKAHQVAISFFTETLLWHDTIGNVFLLSNHTLAGTNSTVAESQILHNEQVESQTYQTVLVPLVPFLSIHTLTHVL